MTVIQRFNSAADLSRHFHILFIDGVYGFRADGRPLFHPTLAPTDDDVASVAATSSRGTE